MKAEQTNLKFKPIQLTLENQEEVDAICTLVNSVRIITIFPVLDSWHDKLNGYGDFEKNIDKLIHALRE